jgi:hypothetical protein
MIHGFYGLDRIIDAAGTATAETVSALQKGLA